MVSETEENALRFGVVAVRKGFITPDQVLSALDSQVKENLAAGKHRRIGVILMEEGYMTFSQVREVLDAMPQEAPPDDLIA